MNSFCQRLNLGIIFVITIIFPSYVLADLFEAEPLVQIPGSNTQIAISLNGIGSEYMTWINHIDSTYSLYIQRIYPKPKRPMLIQSTRNPLIDPDIQINPWHRGYKLVWSEKVGDFWKLNHRDYLDGNWSACTIIADSLQDSILSSAGIYRVCWTSAGDLYTAQLFSSPEDTTWQRPILVDSNNCSNPVISPGECRSNATIVYEKAFDDSVQIRRASWSEWSGQWKYSVLSEARLNRGPRFGPGEGLSFETWQDSVWQASYAKYGWMENFVTTANRTVNYHHPMRFTFPLPTKSARDTLYEYLLVFDSDSLENNAEIMGLLQPPFSEEGELITISRLPGNDSWPCLATYEVFDSMMLAVIWQHETDNGTEIWWARAPFRRIYGAIEEDKIQPGGFSLFQNYPNPFNANTTIRYTLTRSETVHLSIWNTNGQKLKDLVDSHQEPGSYAMQWTPTGISSGIYFYQLSIGDQSMTRKCLYLK